MKFVPGCSSGPGSPVTTTATLDIFVFLLDASRQVCLQKQVAKERRSPPFIDEPLARGPGRYIYFFNRVICFNQDFILAKFVFYGRRHFHKGEDLILGSYAMLL